MKKLIVSILLLFAFRSVIATNPVPSVFISYNIDSTGRMTVFAVPCDSFPNMMSIPMANATVARLNFVRDSIDALECRIADTVAQNLGIRNDYVNRLLNYVTNTQFSLKFSLSDTSAFATLIRSKIPSNNNQLINGVGYLTAEVDGSVTNEIQTLSRSGNVATLSSGGTISIADADSSATNEIELPPQTGNSGKFLGTNGSLAAWNTIGSLLSVYSKAGLLSSSAKVFTDTFSVSTATPTISFSSYLSTMGATAFKVLGVTGYRVAATTGNSPNVSVTDVTASGVSLILNQTNTATVTILGINVLSGLPTVLVPDPANVKVVLSFVAW